MKKITLKQRKIDKSLSFAHRTQRGRKSGSQKHGIYVSTKETLIAPKVFRLLNDVSRNGLFGLTHRAKVALNSGKTVSIKLKDVEKLYPCATLYFCAHIETLIEEFPGRIHLDYPSNEVVCQLFQHVGLLGKAGLTPIYEVNEAAVKDWHFVKGTSVDTSAFHEMFDRYKEQLNAQVAMTLAGSMSEAVTNSVQHAYPKVDGEPVKWWMFSELRYHPDLHEHHLTIVIFDFGIGIAQSLRKKPSIGEYIAKKFRSKLKHDQKLLASAVGSSISSTQLPYRGKGLPEMLENIKSNQIGGLLIHSNYGSFLYNARTANETAKPYQLPLDGTLVQWTIPIADEVESAG